MNIKCNKYLILLKNTSLLMLWNATWYLRITRFSLLQIWVYFHYSVFQITDLHFLFCNWVPLNNFSFQLLYSSVLMDSFLLYSNSLLKFSLFSSILLQSSKHLYDDYLKYFIRQIAYLFHLALFLRVSLVFSFETYSSVSSYCLILCVYF